MVAVNSSGSKISWLRGIPSITVCSPDLGNAQHLACEARYTILPSAARENHVFDAYLYLRLQTELRRIAPDMRCEVIVLGAEENSRLSNGLWLSNSVQIMERILSKYESTHLASLERSVVGRTNVSTAMSALPAQKDILYVCGVDDDAIAVRDRLKAPGHAGSVVLSLDANVGSFRENICRCVPDTENIGYLMAHAIIGDIAIPRSSRGFVQVRAVVIDRGTS